MQALKSAALSSLQDSYAFFFLLRASSILLGRSNSISSVQQTAQCPSRSSRAHSSQAARQHEPDPFGDPPALPQRRVVVTGIGMVTPLGVGVADSWQGLVAGRTGVRRLQAEDLPEVRLTAGSDSCKGPPQHVCLQQTAPAEPVASLWAHGFPAAATAAPGASCTHVAAAVSGGGSSAKAAGR